jgi:hypothetical protein
VGIRERKGSEPLGTHRNSVDDIRTGVALQLREKHEGNLLTDHAVSGVEAA